MILKGTIGGSKYQKAPWMATYSDYNYHYIITIFSSRSWGDCFLVGGLEHVLFVPSYWEFCHPNWLNWPIFFRGVGQPPTSIIYIYIYTSHFHQYNYGKSPFFMGKSPFLMGKKVFFPTHNHWGIAWPWPDHDLMASIGQASLQAVSGSFPKITEAARKGDTLWDTSWDMCV